jgi:hypothetical protein
MMPKRLALVAALLLLMACQQAPVRDENSPRSRVSIGSHFILHQVLAVPVGHARVFMQEGQVVAKNKLERYQPHCNIEVHSVSSGGSYIEPDTFVVTAVMEDEVEVVRGTAWQHYASLFYSGDGMDTLMLSRFVRHTLQSASQPEVMRLTCHGGFAEPWQVATPSVREIRQALGELVTLKLQHSI